MSYTRLAIDGGEPVRRKAFPPWPFFSSDEIDAVVASLSSGKVNYWTGEECREFEREFAAAHECKYGIALANGTLALELALRTFEVGPGDEVIVTPRTFVASASCIAMCGATPVFADIDRESQNITAETIGRVISERTKAIIVVHLAGLSCDMDPIMQLAKVHNLKVIEDCAQAQGARYKGRQMGSLGHAGAFSFCQDKIMTTAGEGGMLLTSDSELWNRAWSFKDHGKSFDAVYHRQHPPGFRWLHESVGTNWRMTDVQGALGRVCLRKVPQWVEKRRQNAEVLKSSLDAYPSVRKISIPSEYFHCFYRYYVFLKLEMLREGWTRERIMAAIIAEGVPCFSGSCSEIYLEKCFDEYPGRPAQRLPVARELGETSLAFLTHPTITDADVVDVSRAISKVLDQATR